jgi:hypothetical protein
MVAGIYLVTLVASRELGSADVAAIRSIVRRRR